MRSDPAMGGRDLPDGFAVFRKIRYTKQNRLRRAVKGEDIVTQEAAFVRAERELRRLGIEVQCGVPLSGYVSFRVGGPCRLLARPDGPAGVKAALAVAAREELPFFVLGNGSNLLVADEGYRGLVLLTSGCDGVRVEGQRITAGAGVTLSRLCHTALAHALTGLEFAFGIPGSVGGAIYMNAGAYGGEMSDVLESACFLEGPFSWDGSRVPSEQTLPAGELEFSYRHSRFTGGESVILSGTFCLQPGEPKQIRSRMEEVLARRREKQPLEYPSAGSTFKRPANGYAAALIEQCGLKGCRVGGAQVSEKHSGFIINTGGATCADIRKLIELVQARVKEQTGTELECEVRMLGL